VPSTITRFGGRIIEPARGFEVITVTIRAFPDPLFGSGDGSWTALPNRFPELTIRPADGSDHRSSARGAAAPRAGRR
jgi:hypothetical protein